MNQDSTTLPSIRASGEPLGGSAMQINPISSPMGKN
jgi:hypothetical protein